MGQQNGLRSRPVITASATSPTKAMVNIWRKPVEQVMLKGRNHVAALTREFAAFHPCRLTEPLERGDSTPTHDLTPAQVRQSTPWALLRLTSRMRLVASLIREIGPRAVPGHFMRSSVADQVSLCGRVETLAPVEGAHHQRTVICISSKVCHCKSSVTCGHLGSEWISPYGIDVQQPDRTLPTASNLYYLREGLQDCSDVAATSYGSDDEMAAGLPS
jgi:hypothetical protein